MARPPIRNQQCHRLRELFYSRSHDAVIRVCVSAGSVIETHEHAVDFKECRNKRYRVFTVTATTMPFQKSLWTGQPYGRQTIRLKNIERGEVVSPIGCIASKVSGFTWQRPMRVIVARSIFFTLLEVQKQSSSNECHCRN
jgi:hypothetical protein